MGKVKTAVTAVGKVQTASPVASEKTPQQQQTPAKKKSMKKGTAKKGAATPAQPSSTTTSLATAPNATTAATTIAFKPAESVAPRPPPVVEPPYSCKIMWVKGVVRVIVNLQKISMKNDKCINFTPTTDRFYLDTFKHTKKYKLDFVYPQSVKVDASAPEATLELGILSTDLTIVDWGEAASQHAEIVSNHKGMLKARGIKTGEDNSSDEKKQIGSSSNQKRKNSVPNEKKKSTPTESKSAVPTNPSQPASSQKKTKKQKSAPPPAAAATSTSTSAAAKTPPQKKNIQPSKKQKTSSKKELLPLPVAKVSAEAKSEPAAADAKPKKKKRFLEKSEMSEILGQIVQQVEKKTDMRLHRDEVDSSHLDEVIQSKKEKQENRKKRKLEARAILQKSIKRKKNKKPEAPDSGRKVNFAAS